MTTRDVRGTAKGMPPHSFSFCGSTMKPAALILLLIFPAIALCSEKADLVLVVKCKSKLYLMKNGYR